MPKKQVQKIFERLFFFTKALMQHFLKLYFAFSLVIFIVHQPLFLMSYLKKTPCTQ